ncbi:MAG: hypothetical protein F7B06_00870 [Opitutae bacterium]|nr:hypothetical protein [Opitutae bacterium]
MHNSPKSTDTSSFKVETIAKAVARVRSTSGKAKGSPSKLAAFTLDDVQDFLANKKETPTRTGRKILRKASPRKVAGLEIDRPRESRNLGAASVSEILGYDPAKGWKAAAEEAMVPREFKPYYKLLVQLRQQLTEEIDLHTRETLKKSSKEASGDTSSYSQHPADEGTETFDRDLALNLVSSEQEALKEIEEAIQRIFDGTYGVCAVTGKRISRERLLAVPFTKYSLQGKKDLEKNKRRTSQRGGIFGSALEDSSQYFGDDSE